MKAEQFTVQSYDGGPEYRFFNRMPFVLRADIALAEDDEFESLSLVQQTLVKSVAMCILAANKAGLGNRLKTPKKITVKSCMAFAEEYMIGVDSEVDLGKGNEVEDENPTATPGEAS